VIGASIRTAYGALCEEVDRDDIDVAVRSSATAADMPEASFAGQQESFLNIRGEDGVVDAVVRCDASLFTDRAIAYREERGFGHLDVALSAGVQRMVRSDLAGAGVAFTLDTETGFPDVVTIDAAWGLGEVVVSGEVNPDAYVVFKPLLDQDGCRPIVAKDLGDKATKIVYADEGDDPTREQETSAEERRAFVLDDDEILTLARWCTTIEKHDDRPMDIEWAKDGDTGELFIVQARPETVQSQKQGAKLSTYRLSERGDVLASGLAIGDAIATGTAIHLDRADGGERFEDGTVLVTEMTDPDWVPIMKRAAAIVTDHGGRTAHAAIVSRELGLPAIVGTGDASGRVPDGEVVTVSCAEGDQGHVYAGELEFERRDIDLDALPETETRIMMNIASPSAAFRWWRLPAQGIGLARIAASQYPRPVIVRMSDFKSNEYTDLLGGAEFEADRVLEMLADNELELGENDLEIYMMAEIPSNVTLAAEFAERFDGFSIGSNDLTQLELGIDRDSGRPSELFDEQDEAVTRRIAELIERAHRQKVEVHRSAGAESGRVAR